MKKYEIVSKVKPLNPKTDLQALERLAEIGYREQGFADYYEPSLNNKGSIKLYVRRNYAPQSLIQLEPKNGVLSLYRNVRGSVDFLVSSDSADGQLNIEQTIADCKEIEKKALRQGFLSWPPRILTKEKMKRYGGMYGFILYSASLTTEILLYRDNSKIVEFGNSIREAYGGDAQYLYMISVIGGGMVLSMYLGQKILERLGSLADRIRTKRMSDKVVEYRYGNEVLDSIEEDLGQKELEGDAISLFKSMEMKDPIKFYQKLMEFSKKYASRESGKLSIELAKSFVSLIIRPS